MSANCEYILWEHMIRCLCCISYASFIDNVLGRQVKEFTRIGRYIIEFVLDIPITAKTLPIPNACSTVTFCFWSDFCLIADAWSIFEETSGSQVQSKRQIGSRFPHGFQMSRFSRLNSKVPKSSKWYRSFVSTQSVPFDEHLKYLNPIFIKIWTLISYSEIFSSFFQKSLNLRKIYLIEHFRKWKKIRFSDKNRSLGSALCNLYAEISNNEVQSVSHKSANSTIFILF